MSDTKGEWGAFWLYFPHSVIFSIYCKMKRSADEPVDTFSFLHVLALDDASYQKTT